MNASANEHRWSNARLVEFRGRNSGKRRWNLSAFKPTAKEREFCLFGKKVRGILSVGCCRHPLRLNSIPVPLEVSGWLESSVLCPARTRLPRPTAPNTRSGLDCATRVVVVVRSIHFACAAAAVLRPVVVVVHRRLAPRQPPHRTNRRGAAA
uniref:Uncharacterized protein n=1 Tax=Panagrellus redivivus TaxID=6233 RepID=A0A7E4VN18_PANRE